MADNPTVNGVTVAGDDVGGGVIAQRVKLNIGVDGVGGPAADVAVTNPLPILQPGSNQLANGTLVWANSDPVGTEKLLDLNIAGVNPGRLLLAIVRNESVETALTAKLGVEWTDPALSVALQADLSNSSGAVEQTIPAAPAKAATITAATDVVSSTGHGFQDGNPVKFTALTGGAGLTVGTTYFVRDMTANTFKVAATQGGAAVNVTSDASAATVAGSGGTAFLIDGGLLAAGGRLSLRNITALSGSGAFSAAVQVHALCAV